MWVSAGVYIPRLKKGLELKDAQDRRVWFGTCDSPSSCCRNLIFKGLVLPFSLSY